MKKLVFMSLATLSSTALAQDGFQASVDNIFAQINGAYAPILFWPVPIIKLPLILFIMFFGGIFFTFRYNFVNVRLFKHAIDVLRGHYDDPSDEGEISHFQALTSSLSATVGLGNIAGVAVAIGVGGPGAIFWLWLVAFFGMSMKFSSCTFAQLYRKTDEDGAILGGPMVYISEGLKERGWGKLGAALGIFYAIMTIMASFGGGNLFQGNQTYTIIQSQFPSTSPLAVGIVLAILSGIVLIGGIKRIGEVTSKLIPLMCIFYVGTCLVILITNYTALPGLFVDIFMKALSPDAAFGGFLGVMIQGVKRASFSNEAGLGSAAIAHSAAKTSEPVREGVVAMIGPIIDTHVVCTMTALTILVTGAHLNPGEGAVMTSNAFATLGPVMPKLLLVAICIFAYSTIVSWSYYGERATEYLFGIKSVKYYRIIYVFIIVLGPLISVGNVIGFADLMLLSMAFPNILAMIYMSKIVKEQTEDYIKRYKAGKMPMYK